MYFLGEGVGESIVIKLADDFLAVIDAFGGTENSITASFLSHLNVSRVDFLKMSHIHHDHCSGLSYVMEKFDVRGLGHSVPSNLNSLRNLAVLAELKQQVPGTTSGTTPLVRLFTLINQHLKTKWKDNLIENYKTISNGVSVCRRSYGSVNFSFDCIGPLTSVFDSKFLKDVEKHLSKAKKNPNYIGADFLNCYQEEINNTSAISRIQYGKVLALFPGDSEKKSLKALNVGNICDNLDNIDCVVIKIPHHGSTTSDAKVFFDKSLTEGRKMVAVVCPYNRHNLPDRTVIQMYLDAGYEVYQTSKIDVATLEANIDSDAPSGVVRVVATAEGPSRVELFGNAIRISK